MPTVKFGVFITPSGHDPDAIREHVLTAEESGFDYVSIQDHPYAPTFLDTFALIGSLIGQTRRLRSCRTWRTCHSVRPPCSPRPQQRLM
jgi:alkanesulfonate monooxygenase SsuD/methylene tetrahydromethanopterin reductase-like flavin-dependent oxidoreductase (luciferase family)